MASEEKKYAIEQLQYLNILMEIFEKLKKDTYSLCVFNEWRELRKHVENEMHKIVSGKTYKVHAADRI